MVGQSIANTTEEDIRHATTQRAAQLRLPHDRTEETAVTMIAASASLRRHVLLHDSNERRIPAEHAASTATD